MSEPGLERAVATQQRFDGSMEVMTASNLVTYTLYIPPLDVQDGPLDYYVTDLRHPRRTTHLISGDRTREAWRATFEGEELTISTLGAHSEYRFESFSDRQVTHCLELLSGDSWDLEDEPVICSMVTGARREVEEFCGHCARIHDCQHDYADILGSLEQISGSDLFDQ